MKFHSEDFSHLNLSQAEVGLLENRAASLTCEGNVSISVPFVEQASRSASVWQATPDALSCKVFGQCVQRYAQYAGNKTKHDVCVVFGNSRTSRMVESLILRHIVRATVCMPSIIELNLGSKPIFDYV